MGFVPIHPAIVHLPIAFVLLSVLADFCARLSTSEPRRSACRTVGFWSLVAALAGIGLTIAAGYLDVNRIAWHEETERFVALHARFGWVLACSLALLVAWRWLIWHRGQMTIGGAYLGVAAVVLGLTLFQGWYGGEMVYSYGAGVTPAGQGTEPLRAAQARLATVREVLGGAPSLNLGAGGAETPGDTNQAVITEPGSGP